MPSPSFSTRSEYRAPNRHAFNACGTEGCRSPGNIPRTYGMLNKELASFGGTEQIPTPDKQTIADDDDSPTGVRGILSKAEDAYFAISKGWMRHSKPQAIISNFRETETFLIDERHPFS